MGWLRKLGKKIKKGVKKLFSSKIGSFIGSIALSMIMGPVISRAFNGIKGVFTGAAQKGTETLVQEGVQKVVEEGASKVVEEGAKQAIKDTTVNVVSDTVTGTMEKIADTSDLFVDFGSKGSVALKGEATTAALKEKIVSTATTPSDLFVDFGSKGSLNLKGIDSTAALQEKIVSTAGKPKLGYQIKQNFADFGTGVKEFATDPFGKTKEYIGDEFIPDVARSVGQQYVMGALQEEPVDEGGYGVMPSVGSFEPAQSAYMAEVRTQMPNLPATNFQQLNQSLLYGTLSPQYLLGQAQYS